MPRYAQKDYYDKLLFYKKSDISTWKILNNMIKSNKMCSSYPDIVYHNSGCITNIKTIAKSFNIYFFNNVSPVLAGKIKASCIPQSIFKTMVTTI